MTARRRSFVFLVLIILAACTSKGTPVTSGVRLLFPRGGLVRVGMLADYEGTPPPPGEIRLDPNREYTAEGFEMLRSMVRTLYQYSGHPTSEGGSELRPDLATGPPDVSADGLTWTVHIRPGIRYAPPLARQQVVASDFITALKRTARVTPQDSGDYAVYYSVIQGFDGYAKGKTDSISGIATPDAHTIVFTLTTRVGDFADRFALPATAPIPTLASAPSPFGVATGHDSGYGPFLVASGPYMLAGSESLTPGAPAKDQKPAAGFPSHTAVITLVRNPSWVSASDDLRPAYAQRIEIHLVPSIGDIQHQIDTGKLDLMMFNGTSLRVPRDQFHRYQANPSLGRAFVSPRDTLRYVTINLAAPPFDDVHARKAANYIVNKSAYISAVGELSGEPATHLILDSLENNQLVNYDPYRTTSPTDALAKAKAEMRLSRYDPSKSGTCDVSLCKDVSALAFSTDFPPAIKAARSVARDLALIGIKLKLRAVTDTTFFQMISTPQQRIALGIAPGWAHDFLNASNFVTPLFAGPGVSSSFTVPGGGPGQCCNFSLVGASSEALKRWGYPVRDVPSADDRINQCLHLAGQPQVQCWTALDEYLTETVVPWVPLANENSIEVVPARVVNYAIDQFTTLPSLDQIVVQTGATPSSS